MIAAGVDIISHCETQNRNLVNFPEEVQYDEVSKNRDFLISLGAGRGAYGISYPQGLRENNREIRDDVLEPITKEFATMKMGGGNCFNMLPKLDPYNIHDFNYHNDWFNNTETDLKYYGAKIKTAAKYGLWMVFGTHNVNTPSVGDPWCISENTILGLIDIAADQKDVESRNARMNMVSFTQAFDDM